MRQPIRIAGFLMVVAAAVAVFIVLAPKHVTDTATLPSATQYETLISQALADDTSNNLRTSGAPQQTVVNGWTAKDLLTIIAKENADLLKAQGAVVDASGALQTNPFDERIPALLLIGVIAVAWAGVSAPSPKVFVQAPAPATPFPPQMAWAPPA